MKKKEKDNFGWESITIDKYYSICDIIYDDDIDDITKNVKLVALIADIQEDEIWKMEINDVGNLTKRLDFLNTFTLPKHTRMKITLPFYGEVEVMKDISKMTYAQYVDYQTFSRMKLEDGIEKILSVFILPRGKKYNDGYDIVDFQRVIRENMPFRTAQGLLSFFLGRSANSMVNSLTFLDRTLRKMEESPEKEELMEKRNSLLNQMETLCSIGSSSSRG